MKNPEFYEEWLIKKISLEIGIPVEDIQVDQPLSAMGLNSQQFVLLSGELEDFLGVRLDPTIIFEYPTIREIAIYVSSIQKTPQISANKKMDFSLFFFSVLSEAKQSYDLIEKAALFADQADFHGVWVPERHFHELGGGSPNPALLCAALAKKTKQLRLKAGSVVTTLQDPLRTVEDWSMVDQLSDGRVEISLASGWHVDDFVFAPNAYQDRKDILFERFHEIQKLWSGRSVERLNGQGHKIAVKTFPRPVQKNLNLWVTAIGSKESFEKAGACGAHLLTCLLNQDVSELAEKIKIYRLALEKNSHGPRKIAVFLHTFIGDSEEHARHVVQKPFEAYLESTLDLLGNFGTHHSGDLKIENFSEEQKISLRTFAFERYFSERSLMGSSEKCEDMLTKLQGIGVDEVACLVDFGIDSESVLEGLKRLQFLKKAMDGKVVEY